MKCTLLLGAGVDQPFGLPQGTEFALDSIFIKNEDLLNAVKEFFNLNKKYTLFYSSVSVAFRICIFSTISYIKNKDAKLYDKYQLREYTYKDYKTKETAKDAGELCEESIDKIKGLFNTLKNTKNIKELLENEPQDEKGVIIQNLLYKGNIESYFYCLMDKEKYGNKGYYTLFYYFWSCYFSILKPILEKTSYFDGKVLNSNIYLEMLNNIKDITSYIYNDSILKKYQDLKEKNYYEELKELNVANVLTTNYTPFARLYYPNKCCYLAGDLKTFELSEENEVSELNNHMKGKKFFPFIMTQAPIKPLISSIQIREYYKAIKRMNKSNYLIIVGYSLCDNDNHILTIIKEYLKKKNKRIIYCSYEESFDNKDIEKYKVDKKYDLENILHFHDDKDVYKIIVLPNNGNAIELVENIKKTINEIEKI